MDRPLVEAPLQALWSDFRLVQKRVERELEAAAKSLEAAGAGPVAAGREEEEMGGVGMGGGSGVEGGDGKRRGARHPLSERIAALEALERELEAADERGARYVSTIVGRLEHSGEGTRVGGGYTVDELAAEYLARAGHVEEARAVLGVEGDGAGGVDGEEADDASGARTGRRMATAADLETLGALGHAVRALSRERDVGPAVAWCHAHASRLRRVGSCVEVEMCAAEVAMLLRHSGTTDAQRQARESLIPALQAAENAQAATHSGLAVSAPSPTSQARESSYAGARRRGRAAAIIALGAESLTHVSRAEAIAARAVVADILRPSRWKSLVAHFVRDTAAAAGILPSSRLRIAARVGASALEIPHATTTTTTAPSSSSSAAAAAAATTLPLGPGGALRHQSPLAALLASAPPCRHVRSVLICPVTRSPMEGANRPVVLPSGVVVGESALPLLSVATASSDATPRVRCPHTGHEYPRSAVRKLFLA